MFPRATRLFTLGGIDVRADRSLVLIAFLVVLSFQSRWAEAFGAGAAWGMALGAAVLFFVSLLAHELGHAFEARHRGIEVGGITLFLLGGVTEMRAPARRPRDEFAIAAVGPFLSLVAGSVFGLAATVVDLWFALPHVEQVLGVLGWLNVALAVFNLIPAAPLDGGRILRAAVWAVLRDRNRAVVAAAATGQLFALALGAFAVQSLAAGNLDQGLVDAFVAWFLWTAARAEQRHAALERLLEGRHAGALEVDDLPGVDADASLSVLLARLPDEDQRGAVPVDHDGEVVGALVLREARAVHPQDQDFRLAREIMRPADELPRIAASTSIQELLEVLQSKPLVLLELDDGRTTTLTAREFGIALERIRRRTRGMPVPGATS